MKYNNVGEDTWEETVCGSGVYRVVPYDEKPTDFFADH